MWALHQALVLLLGIMPFASARQNMTHLRRNSMSLTVSVPRLLVLLGHQRDSCQCTFDDTCSCKGALKFMDCIKKSCNSGDCRCIDKSGENHFLEACSSMSSECSGIGLKCTAKEATCNDNGVAWHEKLKEHAVEDSGAGKEKAKTKEPAKEPEKKVEKKVPDPKKYVMHTKYKSKVKELHSEGHRVFAQGILCTVLVLSITIAMASSPNALIAKSTWSIIDFVVVTFLALAWFIVVTYGLDYYKLAGLARILVHMTISVVFLLISSLVSFQLNKSGRTTGASIFNGIFTPMVMFCNYGFVETLHKERVVPWPFGDQSYVFFVMVDLMVWYTLLALFFYHVVSRLTQKGWNDDTENHMAGGALAGAFVLWLHMVISGSYQTLADPHRHPPSFGETVFMNFLSVVFLVAAVALTPVIKKLKSRFVEPNTPQYAKARVCDVLSQFLSFLPRFSFVMALAHLIVDNMGYSDGAVAARLHLALASTAIGVLLIILCAKVPFFQKPELNTLLVSLGGFMIGVAWSGLLDNSINMMVKGEGYAHPFPVKLGITAFLTLFIFPVYVYHLKPLIDSKTG